ncbi:DNA repair protein XRCC2 homolog isoform X3 [Olea europaea var. sylvestris]|uniref:DNA repair protein XRCC2 homolog isoform X3 n=1 Tax=Olea europaea var. sylvestris TaxID=158386 RepID=UPI000C1CCE03|nr:DNA repair protein XRCC2 homolog isoform X3 [Olea europaea var. sylvestris]
MATTREWLKPDETAKELLVRVLTERPLLLLPPPLHRLPFRVGNVVEIVGPSPSAKTLILIQVNKSKEWNGVEYGGLGRAVMFVDLDCRFDVLRFSQLLKRRLIGSRANVLGNEHDDFHELLTVCMRRFLYIRCYNSLEFLVILKTMHCRLQKEKETQAGGVYLLMIDSIGAFYWMDRALLSSSGSNNRKSLSLQCVVETMVQEIQRLLLVHPMLVLASKSASFGDKQSTTEVIRNPGKGSSVMAMDFRSGPQNLLHREYMPSVWQSFVTHRIQVRPSDYSCKYQNNATYLTEWLLPSLKFSDKFIINDNNGAGRSLGHLVKCVHDGKWIVRTGL